MILKIYYTTFKERNRETEDKETNQPELFITVQNKIMYAHYTAFNVNRPHI